MKRFLIIVLALAACGGPTEPANAVTVSVTMAARPTTSFSVTNATRDTVGIKACGGQVGHVQAYTGPSIVTIVVCSTTSTLVKLAPGTSLAGSVATETQGKYQLSAILESGVGVSSSPFDVP